MQSRTALIFASLAGLSAVILGAFGSHALRGQVPDNLLSAWHTAVNYQFFHTLAVLGVILLQQHQPALRGLQVAVISFMLGIVLFSGSLYALVLTGVSQLGVITPLGGIALMTGWLALLMSAFRWPLNQPPRSPSN